jgi:hypothetical protein
MKLAKELKAVTVFLTSSFLILSCSNSGSNSNEPMSALKVDSTQEVYGGTANSQPAPEFIYGFILPNRNRLCNAIRITERHFLTAAHCVANGNLADYNITLFQYSDATKYQAYRNTVIKVYIHPQYFNRANEINALYDSGKSLSIYHSINHFDLAIVTVNPSQYPAFNPEKLKIYTKSISPVAFAQNFNISRAILYSAWDHRSLKDDFSSIYPVNMALNLSFESDINTWKEAIWTILPNNNSRLICKGDSGAGLIMINPEIPNSYYLLGIAVTANIHINGQCGNIVKFANPALSLDWINSVISQ